MPELTDKSPAGRPHMTNRPGLAAFLNALPHLYLSDPRRRDVCARFGLTNAELSAALFIAYRQKGGRL